MTVAAQVMDGLEDAVRSAGVRYIRIDGGTDMRVAPRRLLVKPCHVAIVGAQP